jgi:hypothetical protein
MNEQQLEELRALLHTTDGPCVAVSDLDDHGDRTLVYGYTLDRETFHVYLSDGLIHRFIYRYRTAPGTAERSVEVVAHDAAPAMAASKLVPSKRAYPQLCDAEFCRILIELGAHVAFTSYEEPQERGTFAGEIAALAAN